MYIYIYILRISIFPPIAEVASCPRGRAARRPGSRRLGSRRRRACVDDMWV